MIWSMGIRNLLRLRHNPIEGYLCFRKGLYLWITMEITLMFVVRK
nr:MAG TPA: hypothetical protein [Caudoviricetes sp.]